MTPKQGELQRYDDRARLNHWLTALLLGAAAISGFAFFHPAFFFGTVFFGGPQWSRILHPFLGVATALVYFFLYLRVYKENKMTEADKAWAAKAGQMLRGHKDGMPPVGKYNAGQKRVFWITSICLLLLLVTGFLFWQPWFAPSVPITVSRAAVLLHAVAAVVLMLGIIVHVYAAIWVKGTIRAMTRGTVSEAWAKRHHALWHEQMTRGK